MKKFLIILLTFVCLFSLSVLVACSPLDIDQSENNATDNTEPDDGSGNQPEDLPQITGITFDGLMVDYDGTPKTLSVSGAIDTDEVTYSTTNTYTNAGTYNITATVKRTGYQDLILNATLTINKIDITDVEFSDVTTVYDGGLKTISVSGNRSSDVITYSIPNSQKNAGTYNISATIKRENYNDLTLTARLVIRKAEITGVVFNDSEFVYDGQSKSIFVDEQTLPEGVSVTYYGNGKVDDGEYIVTASLHGDNYITKSISANLKIKKSITQLVKNAQEIISKVFKKPDPWGFIPQALSFENLKANSIQQIDFSQGFVSVNSIPQNGIGKQLNVMYSILSKMDTAILYMNKVNSVLSALTNAYQLFLNDNPDDYAVFEKDMEHFDVRIELNGESYTLLVKFTTVALEMYYDGETQINMGRVQLNESTALKYSIGENTLEIDVKAVGLFAGSLVFAREGDNVAGTMFEFFGTETKNIKTSAIININSSYTTIMSNKRESDDLLIEGYAEVYDSKTGCFVGAEVKETVKKKDYDTMWFNLCDVSGINTIKVLDEQNFMNADTIYINGSSESLHSKNVSLLDASRRFDIEMKEMYFYVYNAENEEYDKISIQVPMLFVQKENLSTFGEDFYDENKDSGCSSTPEITIGNSAIDYINSIYEILLEGYTEIKDAISYNDIIIAVGNKNEFFE